MEKLILERDILCELNPKLKYADFKILDLLSEEYDIFGLGAFEDLILGGDLADIITAMVLNEVPARVVADNDLTRIVEWDYVTKKAVRVRECTGSYYIDEQIKRINDLLKDGCEAS